MNKEYNFGDDVRLVVGDEKQPVFYPRMKIKRWDNEVNFSVGVISKHRGSDKHINDRVEWTDEHGIKATFYEKDDKQFEFEVEIANKPKSNVLHLSIETKGLDFYYQPELTEEEKNEYMLINKTIYFKYNRPENVEGSYAVYHKTMQGNYIGGNNYRAGKAFHIYRPYATDSNGWKVWCDLYIEDDMQITIPQHFIDNAVYPIIVDPTFGCDPESPGSTGQNMQPDEMHGVLYTSPGDAVSAQSISMYTGVTYGEKNVKGILVLHSNLNIVSNGIGGIVSTSGDSWITSTFSTSPSLSASTEYVLSLIRESGYRNCYIHLDLNYPDLGHHDSTNSYSSPTNPTDATHNSDRYSIYCTYTTAAAGGGGGILFNPFAGPFIGPFGGPI